MKKLFVEINKTIEIEIKENEISDIIEKYGNFDEDNASDYYMEQIEEELLSDLILNSDIWIEDEDDFEDD